MTFKTPLIVSADSGKEWILEDRLVYDSPSYRVVTVPKGFKCDLASIPRIFRLLIPVNDKHRKAAVLHDYLYDRRGHLITGTLNREQCDKMFLEAMESTGVAWWKRQLMFYAVRIGGMGAWYT